MTLARALYEIQKIELDIIERAKRMKSVNALLEDDDLLRQAKEEFAAAEAALDDNSKLLRDMEIQIEAVVEKRKATETRLYSGSVGNPKELQDMQMEVESLTRRRAQLDDQLLQLMITRDQTSQDREESKQLLEEINAQHDEEQRDLMKEKTALSGEIERLKTARKSALAKTPGAALQTYNNMRRAKGNRPVAVLREKTCTICGIQQDNTVLSAINRGEDLVNCSNCGRILLKI
ncbi:MAG: C4-type zinc ribbon domain-containing protein [Chloroflexota bacterium]|nr:C4-type zinc ribbon domain-containing protein [Chloroflexota bacterium]